MGASSEIAMPLDSTAECAEERRGLKTVSKLCALRVLHGDISLDFQIVPVWHQFLGNALYSGVTPLPRAGATDAIYP